jgi:hypothetical protein
MFEAQKTVQTVSPNGSALISQNNVDTLVQQGGIAVAIILAFAIVIAVLMGATNQLVETVLRLTMKHHKK